MIDFRTIKPNEPITLNDRTLGICIRFSESEIGVQVPGEQAIRWVSTSCVERSTTGLIENIPQHTRMSQQIITGINQDGSYNTVDGTTFDGKIIC